jgi:hypothetical protein
VAEALVKEEQKFVNHRYNFYKQLSQLDWSDGEEVAQVKATAKLNTGATAAPPKPEGEG